MTMGSDSGQPAVAGGSAPHIPVLGPQAIELLAVRDGGVYLDATFGAGGHSRAILAAGNVQVLGLDRDPTAIALGADLVESAAGRLTLVQANFADLDSIRKLFRAFDEKARLLDLMTRYLDSERTCVVLGSEADLATDPRLSAVLTSYGTGETLTGMLGVIGPARREYPRVIPVVELLGRALSERLEGRELREPEDDAK